jgi:hypothetical protein
MPNLDHRSKVTIEDLLHLKRAERPPAEFWNRFESELRQKQLAALLQRRPWWQGLPNLLTRRVYLPIGATAMVAFTLVSVKYYSATQQAPAFEPIVSHAAHLQTAARVQAAPAAARSDEVVHAPTVEPTVATLSDRLPDRASELTPWSAPRTEQTPSAKSIAASIAQLEVSEPDLANVAYGGTFAVAGSRFRHQDPAAMVETASVTTSASRRSRMLAQLDDRRFAPEPQAPELVRERLVRRLAETDFNDSYSRVGLERGGVSLKF